MSETPVPTNEYLKDKTVHAVAALGSLRGLIYAPGLESNDPVRVILGRHTEPSSVIAEAFGDFSLGDIALLRTLCDKILSDVYANQSMAAAIPTEVP